MQGKFFQEMEQLVTLARTYPLAEGSNATAIPFATIHRFTTKTIQMPQTNQLYLYLILDGILRLHTHVGILDYVPGQYSISKIDTPLSGSVLAFSSQQDFLALSLEFTSYDIISAFLSLDSDLSDQITNGQLGDQCITVADHAVLSTVFHLLSSAQQPFYSNSLRDHILQELLYYVLCGSCGDRLLQSIADVNPFNEIYTANNWIKEHFRSSFTVEELAKQWNMSASLFRQKFKHALGMGPLQCQKRLRLTEGRRLMLDAGKNVTQAAAEVGYESLSQFIRDYQKMFGAAPKKDIETIRKQWKK